MKIRWPYLGQPGENAANKKPLEIGMAFEHIGKDFRMDSSFLRRFGIDDGWGKIGYNFSPDSQKLPWLRRITPRIQYQHLHDPDTKMDDSHLNLGFDFYFIKEGYWGFDYFARKESWEGETFDLNNLTCMDRFNSLGGCN